MAHNINTRSELHGREFRATCECGWTEKARTQQELAARIAYHKKFPHKS